MNKLRLAVLAFAVLAATAVFAPVYNVGAATPKEQVMTGANQSGAADNTTLEVRIGTITSILLFVIGALAVIMIIVGGIKYVTSNGDASRIKAAKDTIMYSVVGLAIALLAYAVVNFVVRNI